MTTEQSALLDLVKISVTSDCLFGEAVFNADWKKLFELACKQGVASVTWRGIEILFEHEVNECPQEVKLQWYAASDQTMMLTKKKTELAEEFAVAVKPLELVILKGLDYGRYWKNPLWRDFGDLDIVAVNSSFRFQDSSSKLIDEKAIEIGLKVEDDDYKHTHIAYNGLTVENHHYFTSFGGTKAGKILEEELRKLFEGGLKSFENGLKSPNLEFTAVFMLAHAQNHFFLEGITLRHILDWHFFLTRERENVDWAVVNPILEKTGLMAFAALLTQFCKQYFGLRLDMGTPRNDELLTKFTEDLFAEHMNPNDRRWNRMLQRMWQRFVRNIRFAELNKMSVLASLWKWVAYASFFHRKPVLK